MRFGLESGTRSEFSTPPTEWEGREIKKMLRTKVDPTMLLKTNNGTDIFSYAMVT